MDRIFWECGRGEGFEGGHAVAESGSCVCKYISNLRVVEVMFGVGSRSL